MYWRGNPNTVEPGYTIQSCQNEHEVAALKLWRDPAPRGDLACLEGAGSR
jgi:hypothetical protein